MSDYMASIGRVDGGKVHMAHGAGDRQRILCRFGANKEYTTETIAEKHDGDDMRDVLMNHGVRVSHLCKNCFDPAFRAQYQARVRAAAEAG